MVVPLVFNHVLLETVDVVGVLTDLSGVLFDLSLVGRDVLFLSIQFTLNSSKVFVHHPASGGISSVVSGVIVGDGKGLSGERGSAENGDSNE